MSSNIRLVTYNIHSCRGTDGKMDIERIVRVLSELDADVIALQEVQQAGTGSNTTSQLATLSRELEMEGHFTKTRPQGDEDFGIATLVRHPFQVRAEGTLPNRRGEPRAAQWLNIRAGDTAIDLVNTHLSVNFFERLSQLRALWRHPETGPSPSGVFPRLPTSDQLVLVGDFNAGYLSPEYRYLSRRLRNAQRCVRWALEATYPSRFPLLRLDHVWVAPGWDVQDAVVARSPEAQMASDHLPLVVTLQQKQPDVRRESTSDGNAAIESAASPLPPDAKERAYHATHRSPGT